MNICGTTRTCGLIGNPVEHSVSPLMQNFFAKTKNIDMAYVTFHVPTGLLGDAIKGAFALNILGCNVTVPYKSDVIAHLVQVDELAAKIGAVNTLVRCENGFKGYNTDISGLFRAMTSEGIDLSKEKVILLGSGGVGRAVAFMCAANHAKSVTILNRSEDKAVALAKEVSMALDYENMQGMGLAGYKDLAKDKYLVIQCTNVGMYPNIQEVLIQDEAFYDLVGIGYDLIFNPWETSFMKKSKAHGAKVYNGLKMLLYQGVDAFELWNHCKISKEEADEAYALMQENLRHE